MEINRKLMSMVAICMMSLLLTSCDEFFDWIHNPINTHLNIRTAEMKLLIGQQETRQASTVSPGKITYASDAPTIATVDANGTVTAIAEGSTRITASVAAIDYWTAASVSYPVTVSKPFVPVSSVTINKTSLNLTVGGKETLTADVAPEDATDKTIVWRSADDSKASVSQTGEVTAVAGGTVQIYATATQGTDATTDDVTALCTITITVPNPELGDLYYSDGTYSSTLVAGKTPIGVIAYLGTDAFTETGTNVGGSTFTGHGLVLCLKNAASNICWSTETSAYEFGEGARVNSLDALKRTTNVSGYTNTATLAAKADAATKYPAAWQAKNYTALAAPVTGTTGWFLPSAQQWAKMMTGLGGLAEGDIKWDTWFNNDHSAATVWETAMAKAGAKGTAYDSVTDAYMWYLSSSEYAAGNVVSLNVDATGTGTLYGFDWVTGTAKGGSGTRVRVRPVLAF